MRFAREYRFGTERQGAGPDPEDERDLPRKPVPGKRTEVEQLYARPGDRARWSGAEGEPPVPGRRALTDDIEPAPPELAAAPARVVQRRTVQVGPIDRVAEDAAKVRAAAERGTRGAESPLPHLDRIQRAFGRHDVTRVRAHLGSEAAEAAGAMGAVAFATGDRVAFAEPPSLETAAHEAAHAIQQRGEIRIDGGVGQAGDAHERNADEVAARVVAGESAEALLDPYAPPSPGECAASASAAAAVQRREIHSLHGKIVTDTLTRKEILAIYKLLNQLDDQGALHALRAAIEKREYIGAAIDLDRIRPGSRNLRQAILDNKQPDYVPDLHGDRTVGFEVEFGYHQNPLLTFTHIELARSVNSARVNDLPFKLETDAGSTVELVTPPLWIDADEEHVLKNELETFARNSVLTPVTIANWVEAANTAYPMGLAPVPAEEIRASARYMSSGVDLDEAMRRAQSKTLIQDIGQTVLSPSQKTQSGAHTQVNKAISIAGYGAQRAELYDRIRRDLSQFTSDPEFLKIWLESEGMWDDAFAGESVDINAVNATIKLLQRKRLGQAPDMNCAAYLWESHMQCVAGIFRELIVAVPEQVDNPFGVQPPDNSGPVCIVLGEKSVAGALATIGENLEFILQKNAWELRDSSLFQIQDTDSLLHRKAKALARWHTSVKDITGIWFKGDLRQVLLNEKVGFPLAEKPGVLEQKVMERWQQLLPVQLVPYRQTLASLGVTVDEQGVITETSAAWLELPLPDPYLYVREWSATLRSMCRLIEQVTAEHKDRHVDPSFHAPDFLSHFNDHLYNPREDTLINSQYVVCYPDGGEHQYVVEKR